MQRHHRLLLLAAMCVWITGCTAIPQAQLAAYNQAFAETRQVGENIVLDAAGELSSAQGAAAADVAAAGDAIAASDDRFTLDLSKSGPNNEPVDPVAARLLAWEVLGKYTDTLNMLAEGRRTSQVRPAVNSLLGTLQKFPVEIVVSAAESVVPFVEPAIALLEAAVRENDRRRFVELVTKASPEILGFVNNVLRPDALDLYAKRLTLRNGAYGPLTDQLTGVRGRFRTVVQHHRWQEATRPDADSAIENASKILRTAHEYRKRGLGEVTVLAAPSQNADPPAGTPDVLVLADLEALNFEMGEIVGRLNGLDRTLLAYKKTIEEYDALLSQFAVAVDSLSKAVLDPKTELPDIDRLVNIIATTKTAYRSYQNAR